MLLEKIRVLVVDDQPLVLEILSRGLSQDSSIEVVGTATDGLVALAQVRRLQPDVIVLDMEMPNMNGLQFLHKQMPLHPIPTIVLSSVTSKDSQITQDAFEAGAVDFLPKPTGGPMGIQNLLKQLWVKIKIAATKDVSHLKLRIDPRTHEARPTMSAPKNLVLDRNAKVNQSILGMGAWEVSADPSKKLKIFALGSCVGLMLYSDEKNIVALAHIVLPTSSTDLEKSKQVPGYFADTAIQVMVDKMISMGCAKNTIKAKMAGGAKTRVDIGDYFGVGQRNHLACKAGLLKNGIKIISEEVGGEMSRTASCQAGDNNYYLHHPDKGTWTI